MDGYGSVTVAEIFPNAGWAAAASCGPNGGNCVEVNLGAVGFAGVRDGTVTAGPVLAFPGKEWSAFLTAAKSGRFDLA